MDAINKLLVPSEVSNIHIIKNMINAGLIIALIKLYIDNFAWSNFTTYNKAIDNKAIRLAVKGPVAVYIGKILYPVNNLSISG